MTAAELAECLEGRREGNQWRCRCPVHDGRALMVKESDRENPVVHCFGGCEFRDVWAALKDMGLWVDDRPSDPAERKRRAKERELERAKRIEAKYREIYASDSWMSQREYLEWDRARATIWRLS